MNPQLRNCVFIFQNEPDLVFPVDKVPVLTRWIEEMEKDPAVAQYALPAQVNRSIILIQYSIFNNIDSICLASPGDQIRWFHLCLDLLALVGLWRRFQLMLFF